MKKAASSQRTQFIMMFFAFAFGMILSNLLNTQSKTKHESRIDEQEILFIYRGIEKTLEHISTADRLEIETLNHQKIKLIEKAALRQYFSDEAQSQSISIEDAVEKILNWEKVSDADVNDFYQKNQNDIKKPFFEVKLQIKRNIELKRIAIARDKLLEKLKIEGNLAILPGS